ncbi:hypothetical protein [Sulfitobacter geojensis]|uniref:hypothetical protein n=1 Tax=Sulfitobacter geojensis TaxID=1342299 RepID=UPI0036DCB334
MDDSNLNKPVTDEARESFTGKTLTDAQFDESWAIAEIMHRGIKRSGSFHEKLTDYSHAFSRSERFDQMKGETIIRDQFKSRYGETMNQMREGLANREAGLSRNDRDGAFDYAQMIVPLISDGDTMPFYRAFDVAGGGLAEKLNITEVGAKKLMKEAFQEAEGRDLYEVGKAVEKEHHLPKRDADRTTKRAATKNRSMSMQR